MITFLWGRFVKVIQKTFCREHRGLCPHSLRWRLAACSGLNSDRSLGVSSMQRAPLRTSCAILILVFSSAAVSRAGTVYWNAGTASGNTSPTSSTDVPATIAVGPISAGNNQGGEAFDNTVSASSGYTFLLNGVSTSASGGFNFGVDTLVGTSLDTSTSTYFSLTVTPDPGTSFQVASIGFGTRSTDKGAQAWTLRSSLDSFASDLVVPGTLPNNSS
jgi:hypothetical protein